MYRLLVRSACLAGAVAVCTSCAQQWQLTGMERTRVLVDKRYDARPDAKASQFLAPYSATVDSMMSPVVGRTARFMASHRPESELSNLLSDILAWASAHFGEKVDFAVYNMGGIRAALPEGNVTVGDVLDVAPFENKISFLTLSGDKVKELFEQMARRGGEGVSASVKLRITQDGRLVSASVAGKPIDDKTSYRIATLDYLAQGNDELVAFKAKTNVVAPAGDDNNVRNIIMDYFREAAAKGMAVDSRMDGRIVKE